MSKRSIVLMALGAIAALVVGWQVIALAGPVGTASGFEDDDGNLVVNSTFDWNGFSPTTWTGTAPFRESSKVASGWTFKGIEDAQATNSDTGFAGGTKQDQNCASVIGAKAPNKDDLRRIYLSTKNVNNNIFLNLAWVRIPQNTTSSSAHVAFEFNKGSTPCGAGSGGLVQRSSGDMLIVYDFEGGGGDPVITLRRWYTTGTNPGLPAFQGCEISSNSRPCWGQATNLTAGGFAEAKVNTTGSVVDTVGPQSPASQTLGNSEFGEAGINLTAAGVFQAGQCENFGKAFAVSRSSGNSGTAQMKDLVGPGNFNLANCGTVITRKVTDPSGDTTTDFNYTTNVTTSPATTTSPFSLKDGQSNTITNVLTGSGKTVTESDPGSGYKLTSIDCSASTVPVANRSTDTTTRAVTFSIAAGETLDCTFTNAKQRGNVVVEKVTTGGFGAFDFTSTTLSPSPFTLTTTAEGQAGKDSRTFSNLLPGNYDVAEDIPAGWDLTSATCDDGSDPSSIDLASGENVTCTFTNTKKTTTLSTSQDFLPNDTATIDGSGTGDFNGKVDFALYKGGDCSGDPVYSEDNVDLTGSEASTTNNTYTISGDGTSEYHWKVSYHDDTNGHPDAESCVEESTVTIDNDNTTP